MTSDPNDRLEDQPKPETEEGTTAEPESQTPENGSERSERRKILIGSQRDPDAYRPKPKRDWEPVVEKKPEEESPTEKESLPEVEAEEPVEAAPAPVVSAEPSEPASPPTQPISEPPTVSEPGFSAN